MTQDELKLLFKKEDQFPFYFEGIARIYERKHQPYSNPLPPIDFNEPFQQIPNKLYKYIDLNGGLSSITHGNIQFSDPLSFWKLEKLDDPTEFWFDKLYMDNDSLNQMNDIIVQEYPDYRQLHKIEIFLYILHNHVLNLTKRNKVLCLAKTYLNDELWKENSTGICIEYDTSLFVNNHLKLKTDKYKLIGNPILYVDKLVKYPIRINDDRWLSNLIFVKNTIPFSREDEYRILCTEKDYNPIQHNGKSKDRIKITGDMLLDKKTKPTIPLRPTFDLSFITKVYYKKTVQDESKLLAKLEKLNIPWKKL